MTTLCITCDAQPGGCNHQAGRYHDDTIAMIPVDPNNWRAGFTVTDEYRERWEAPLIRATPPPEKPREEARPIQTLIVELENWIDLRPALERRVRDTYDQDPLRVTRAVAAVINGAENRRLTNPTGVLVSRLNEIEAKQNGRPHASTTEELPY